MFAYSIDDHGMSCWRATTLREQNKDEAYLERLIAANPLILGLDPYATGLGTRFVAVRQSRLGSPSERLLRPDIVLISETGHVVVVEVKLADNPELRDRRIIAQLIDYATGLANLDDASLVSWLGQDGDERWTDVIRRLLPQVEDVDRLAAAIRERISRAELHMVIACDQAPVGLRETVRSISAQSALGDFQIHVSELTPYVNESQPGGLLVIPQEIARTEIISRTAITLMRDDEGGVTVKVVASSPADVQEAMDQVASRKVARSEFRAVLDAYDEAAPVDLRTQGRGVRYRQIVPNGWPDGVHYEFLDGRGGPNSIGIELHVESADHPELCEYVRELGYRLEKVFGEPEYSTRWFKGCRLCFFVPVDEPQAAALRMQELMDASMTEIEQLLADGRTEVGE